MISELEIDSFDNIEWYIDESITSFLNYKVPKNRVLETFKRIDKLPLVNFNISFSDNSWNFSSLCELPISTDKYKYIFNPDSPFCDFLKFYLLNNIFKKINKIRGLKKNFNIISKFLDYAYSQGYTSLEFIPKKIYVDYFERPEISYKTICYYKYIIQSFIDFYESNFSKINDQIIKEYLKEKDYSKYNAISEANKTPEIPEDYLNCIINYCKKVMLDETEDIYDRCTAAIIILYSQIGFRTGELLTVKVNSLKEEFSPKFSMPLRYLTYKSYKHGKNDNGSTEAVTIINDLAYEAYKILLCLCEPYRHSIDSDYLVVGKYQKRKISNSSRIAIRVRNFYFMRNKNLPCINTQEQYPELMVTPISVFFDKNNNGYCRFNLSSDSYNGLTEDDVLVYPSIHMFRVSICNNLYRQGVPLHYIKKHMNHLSEDMTSYYLRPEKDQQKKYSEAIYTALISGKSKLLGKHSDDFIRKIDSYIENLDINIKSNVNEVIKMVGNKFPLREKLGGICIRCGEVIPCASNDSTDEIYCAFGMCPNHCHMFFMCDISYNEFLNHEKIIQYNKINGYEKATQKEINKIRYVIENSLKPELDELKNEISRKGSQIIKKDYPQLIPIIDNYDEIYKEASKWLI